MKKDIFRTVRELLESPDEVLLGNAVNNEGKLYDDSVENLTAILAMEKDYNEILAALEAVLPDLWDGIELATEQSVNDAWLEGALHRLDAARAAVNKAKREICGEDNT
jgi:hypothetical protein